MAIRMRIRGMKSAIGTLNHFVNRCGNAPSVKNAAMRAIRGRKRPRTRNQIGSVVITLFSIYVRRITEESAVVKCVLFFWWIFIFSYATLLQCGARMAACPMSVQTDSRMAFYGPTSRKVLVACRVLLQRNPSQFWYSVLTPFPMTPSTAKCFSIGDIFNTTDSFCGSTFFLLCAWFDKPIEPMTMPNIFSLETFTNTEI
jgi:hypothetical protein